MTDTANQDTSFVSSWLERHGSAQPDSPIVQAVAEATSDESIDENRLLKKLRALIMPPGKESVR